MSIATSQTPELGEAVQAATIFNWLNFIVLAEDPQVREELGGHVPAAVARIRTFVGRGSA